MKAMLRDVVDALKEMESDAKRASDTDSLQPGNSSVAIQAVRLSCRRDDVRDGGVCPRLAHLGEGPQDEGAVVALVFLALAKLSREIIERRPVRSSYTRTMRQTTPAIQPRTAREGRGRPSASAMSPITSWWVLCSAHKTNRASRTSLSARRTHTSATSSATDVAATACRVP